MLKRCINIDPIMEVMEENEITAIKLTAGPIHIMIDKGPMHEVMVHQCAPGSSSGENTDEEFSFHRRKSTASPESQDVVCDFKRHCPGCPDCPLLTTVEKKSSEPFLPPSYTTKEFRMLKQTKKNKKNRRKKHNGTKSGYKIAESDCEIWKLLALEKCGKEEKDRFTILMPDVETSSTDLTDYYFQDSFSEHIEEKIFESYFHWPTLDYDFD